MVLEHLGEWNIHQMQTGIRRDLREEVDRLGNDPRNGVDLAGLQFLQRAWLIDRDLVDVDTEPLEHDVAGKARPGARRTEIDFLAAQILQAVHVIARQTRCGNTRTRPTG
jgi:hypothetical protein